jgi:manganese/zinc/iron transport system permease protein
MSDLPPWLSFFTFPFVNVKFVLIGCVVLGLGAGLMGCFAFLRQRSLMGDALAHAALPGVCTAFMLTGTKDTWVILLGATASCWLGALAVDGIVKYTRCKEDSALGMVLSLFFGVGILMQTHIQGTNNAAQAGLNSFLFGQASALVERDVWILSVLTLLMVACVVLAYKELKIVSFDPGFATAVGLPSRFIELLLATLIVLAVVIGLQAVGVVLMAAMLVTPAAAARYWTDRLSVMLVMAAGFGMVSGALGAYVSYVGPNMPTGPWMVVSVTTIFVFSFLFAPRRGVVVRLMRHRRFQRKTAMENVLRTMYLLGERLHRWDEPCSTSELLQYRNMSPRMLLRTIHRLEEEHLVQETAQGLYVLTEPGVQRAARVTRLHRLWELYLTRKVEVAPDHVHDDAEQIEHILTPELEERLARMLEDPETDPHASKIPSAAPGPEPESA